MDKKFVHIDKVFKEGLKDTEVSFNSNAWQNMKDLLDQNLPVENKVIHSGSNRFSLPFVIALLGISAIVGSYFMFQNEIENSLFNAGENTSFAQNDTHQTDEVNGEAGQINLNDEKLNVIDNKTSTIQITNDEGMHSDEKYATNHNASGSKQRNGLVKSNIAAKTEANFFNKTRGSNKENDFGAAVIANTKGVEEHNIIDKETTTELYAVNELPAAKEALRQNKALASASEIEGIKEDILEMAKKDQIVLGESGSELMKKDLVKKTETVIQESNIYESGNSNRFWDKKVIGIQKDTISITVKDTVLLKPLTPLEMWAVKDLYFSVNDPFWGASLASSNMLLEERLVKFVDLKNYRVKENGLKKSSSEFVKNAAQNLSTVFDGTKRYYMGFNFGGQSMLNSGANAGLYAGLGFYYSLAERWALGLEMKYSSRSVNYEMSDNSEVYTFDLTQAGSLYNFEWQAEGFANKYRFSSIKSIEIPVIINYQLGRMSLFGGVNTSYHLALDPVFTSDVTKKTGVLENQNSPKFPLQDKQLNIQPSDFNASYTMGYILGGIYDFSKTVSLEARWNHALWRSSSSTIGQQISNDIYLKPSFQIGFNIFLGKRDKVIYIIDRFK